MTKVQIDDYNCEECNKTGLGELDIKTGKYSCLMCGDKNKMEKIKTIKQAIKLLTEHRGFEVEDLRKIKYRVCDKEINDYYESEEELIKFANEQAQEDLY